MSIYASAYSSGELGELQPSSLANNLLSFGEAESVRVLNDKDRASVDSLVLAPECFLEPTTVKPLSFMSRLFFVAGALIVFGVVILALWLWPKVDEKKPKLVFQLALQSQSVIQPKMLEAVSPPIPSTPVVEQPEPIETQTTPSPVATRPEPAARSTVSLLSAKEALLQNWQMPEAGLSPEESFHRGTVVDLNLARKLAQIEPGRLVQHGQINAMADVNGLQEVIIGDHCFQVSKLDDQAMRGMGAWTRGLCHTSDSKRNKIEIRVLP